MICYNCRDIGNYARDSPNPAWKSCRYCRQYDYVIEEYLLLIAKMQEKQHAPTLNIKIVKVEPHDIGPSVNVITCNGVTTRGNEEKDAT